MHQLQAGRFAPGESGTSPGALPAYTGYGVFSTASRRGNVASAAARLPVVVTQRHGTLTTSTRRLTVERTTMPTCNWYTAAATGKRVTAESTCVRSSASERMGRSKMPLVRRLGAFLLFLRGLLSVGWRCASRRVTLVQRPCGERGSMPNSYIEKVRMGVNRGGAGRGGAGHSERNRGNLPGIARSWLAVEPSCGGVNLRGAVPCMTPHPSLSIPVDYLQCDICPLRG